MLASAFVLACDATAASAQQGTMMQQQAQPQQQQQSAPGAQVPRRNVEHDFDGDSDISGWHPGLRRYGTGEVGGT